MKSKKDQKLMLCLIAFGSPLVLVLREQWELGLLLVIVFLSIYLFLPKAKDIRANVKYLDIFVGGSYMTIITGSWFLYDNGFDQSSSIWLYIAVVALGYPMFKRLEKYFSSSKE